MGDYVEGAGTAGVVEEIQIFTTKLKTPDNKSVIIPNAKLTGDNITNYSAKEMRRVDLVIGPLVLYRRGDYWGTLWHWVCGGFG